MQDWLNSKRVPRRTKQLEKMKTRTQKLLEKAKAIPQLQGKYENAKMEAQKLAQQRLVAQRSTAVLLSALEDESQYLTELQGVCDIRKRLHNRIETNSFSSLLKIAPQ